jgi:hypothetical protein
VLEIKCPHCTQDSLLDQADSKSFCLEKAPGTEHMSLKRTHQYYYQVQAQIHLTASRYCDFVVWTKEATHLERIFPDSEFWYTNLARVKSFVTKAVLPEMLGRYFSRTSSKLKQLVNQPSTCEPCLCKQTTSETIITCASETCPVKLYHQKCMGLKNKPKKSWLCPTCRGQHKKANKS